MKRSTTTAPKASPLYARIRQILDLYAKLLVVVKGHALRDDFGEARMAVGAMIRKSKTSLSVEGEPIGYVLRSQMAARQTPSEILDAPGQIFDALPRQSKLAAPGSVLPLIRHASRGKSLYPGYGLPGVTWKRAGHG